MTPLQQFNFLKQDLARWRGDGFSIKKVFYLCFEAGIWVTILYRVSRALFLIKIPVIGFIARLIAFFIFKINEFLGVSIAPSCDIGPGLYIGHTGCVFFYHTVVAGRNLSIGQQVTIGTKGLGVKGAPVIGDNVYIGVGAKVLGPIKIGNNARIGANAVVIKDVPDNATVVGVPGKVIIRN